MIALLASLLLAANPPPPSGPPVAEVMTELRKIESAVFRGKVDELRLKYQEDARNKPGNVLLRIYLAWCGLPSDDSWNQLKGIASVNPDNPWVHLGMGRIYTAWKMKDQARGEFETILKKDPGFVGALGGLAELKALDGDLAAAEGQYRGALSHGEDPRVRGGLGLVLLKEGKTDLAKSELDAAVKAWPDQPLLLNALLKLALDAKDTKAAGETALHLAELQPRDPDVRRIIAQMRFDAGDKAEAAREYEKLFKVAVPTEDELNRLEALYSELGDAAGQERTLETHARADRTRPDSNLKLAALAAAKGDDGQQESQLVIAIDRAPQNAQAHLQLARLRVKQKQLFEALNEFRLAAQGQGDAVAEAKQEGGELEASFKLRPRPAKGSVDAIYSAVAKGLNDLYQERKKENPQLAGELKARVHVRATGDVDGVELFNDTVGDPLLAAHLYFSLKDAVYPKQKREPVFEFELGSIKKAK